MLHERHHRPAQGRPLLAPRDRDPLAGLDAERHARPERDGRRAPGRADVPRERLGLPLHVHADRRQPGLPRPASRPAEPARGVRAGRGDGDRRSADDLDGDPAGARREPRRLGPLPPAGDDRRRLGRAARDDRRVRAAARPPRHARVGNDGDGAARHRLRADLARAGAARGRAVRLPREAGHAGAVRRAPRPRRRGPRALGRADDGRARGARSLDRERLLRRRLAGRPLVGGRLVRDRRHRHDRADRLHRDPGPLEGPRQVGRRVDLDGRAGERAHGPSGRGRGGRDRRARTRSGTSGRLRSSSCARARRRRATSCASSWRRSSRSGGSPTGSSSSPRSRRRPSASSARRPCASSSPSNRRLPSARSRAAPSSSPAASPASARRPPRGWSRRAPRSRSSTCPRRT